MEKQKSKEWFARRVGKVTGSNVGAILGLNPCRDADDVLRAMVREYHGAESEFSGNVATQHGNFHEDGAISEYQMETGNTVEECGFFVHPEYDWLGASPDGLTEGGRKVVEIKCPYGKRKDTAPAFKTAEEQAHYWAQMQIEMACTGTHACDFYQWAPGGTSLETVRPESEWLEWAIPQLRLFHERYLSELDNPEHLEPKRKEIHTNEADSLVTEYDELTDAIERAKARKDEILARFIEMANGRNADICGKKLTQVERKGSVSYAKALKELAPGADLSKWSGKPTSYWKLS